MPNTDTYEGKISAILKGEIKRAGHTYASLTEKLNEMGIDEKEANVRNKIGRGKFSAAFMLQICEALGLKDVRL
jgi:3-mercaptopyruvate sulfurtransferase SseA